ncbi:putative glycerol-3-phosphate transporter 4 [Nannochloris sp. 'desiccata']|nr:putative glycerol-3-phosphate transporter 4 [Chlorella desiccata (nom. nud.)]
MPPMAPLMWAHCSNAIKLAGPDNDPPLLPLAAHLRSNSDQPSSSSQRATFNVEAPQPAALPGIQERNNLQRRGERSGLKLGTQQLLQHRLESQLHHHHVNFNPTVTDLRTGDTEPLRTESQQDLKRRAFLASLSGNNTNTDGMEQPWVYNAPIGHRVLESCSRGGRGLSLRANRMLVLVLTFLCYAAYHASRKPPSIVKSVLHGDAGSNDASVSVGGHRRRRLLLVEGIEQTVETPNALEWTVWAASSSEATTAGLEAVRRRSLLAKKHGNHSGGGGGDDPGWAPFNNAKIGKSLLGDLDLAFLGSYALGMFVSGHLGDRVDLRHFLTGGMLGSGTCVALFGAAYFWNIHTMGYFVVVQVIGGLLQATGWPSVVSVMANWFGQGKRGLIMGVWNAHTSIGNIIGSLLAASMLKYGWGWSFVVPGVLMIAVGVLIFLFLVVEPQDIGFLPQSGSALGSLAGSYVGTPGGGERSMGGGGIAVPSPDGMSDSERALLERKVAQLAEERGGMVPARVAASMEAHHYLHPPKGRHGMMAMGSTLVIMNEKRDSVEGSEDEEYYEDTEALLGGLSPSSTAAGAGPSAGRVRGRGGHGRGSVSFLAAWCIPGVAVYAFTLFFAKLTAYTFLYWLPYYINSTEVGGEHLTPTQAGNLSILFDVGGVLGGVLAGYFSDASNSPAIVSCSFVYLAIPTLWLYRAYGAMSFTLNISLMMAAGFFVNGPYALITTAVSADLGSSSTVGGNEKALATVTAIIDGMGSIGAALGPMVTGYISELPGGFDNVFMMLYGAGLCAGLLLSGLVLRELGELLGVGSSAKNTSSGGTGKRADGSASRGQYAPVLAAGDVVNSAQFAYNPPDQGGGGSGEVMIDNERGLLRTSFNANGSAARR